MEARDPKPEILRLEELALLVKAGEIKLPRFQRPFVWRRPDMLKLLDSIYKGYPIGSLLLWNSSQPLTSERTIAGLEVGNELAGRFPTNYLLDGQQRLTTLCGALFWRGVDPNSIWEIYFDLNTEEFVHPKNSDAIGLFPLNRLINTSDFIRQCMKFEHHEQRSLYVARAERLLRAVKDYKVAVVKIGDMSLEEVAPIFERINSTGRKLTMVDLMMAATWSDEFDLSKEIDNIRAECDRAGLRGVKAQVVLRSIAAAAGFGINKEDTQRLRELPPAELRKSADSCRVAMVAAAKFLIESTPIRDSSFIPYAMQLTHLVEIFRLRPQPTLENRQEMVSWIWYTSASQYFGGASTGQNSRDLESARSFGRGHLNQLYQREELDVTSLLFGRFNLRTASSTTFALMLNALRPATTLSGKPLDDSHFRVKSGQLFGSFAPKEIASLNISKVLDPYGIPGSHVPYDWSHQESHLLSTACARATLSENVLEFVEARGRLVADMISSLTGCITHYKWQGRVHDEDALGLDDWQSIDEES